MDRSKTEFFTNISHEFRTPLTLMLSPLEDLLNSEEPLPPAQRSRAEVIQRSGSRLHKLVNNLLDFSGIESNRITAAYQPTDLSVFTTELASVFRSIIERSGLQFIIKTKHVGEPVFVDREMWEKVVFNLLSNAFKFTLKGSITVQVQKLNNYAELQVIDTGVGIPNHFKSKIFERFHRVETSKGRTFEGTGIGLALVQELVRLHKGTITFGSTEGEGTTFQVLIPLGTSHLPPEKISTRSEYQTGAVASSFVEEASKWDDQLQTGSPVFSPEESDELRDFRGATRSPALFSNSSETPSEEESRKIILYADDDSDMRKYVKKLLEADTYWKVVVVEDGQSALEYALKRKPDLILTDVMMPNLDGFGLLKELRANNSTQTIPVILLSGLIDSTLAKVEGMKNGADDFINKPFPSKELIARVEGHLKVAQIRKSAAEKENELIREVQSTTNKYYDVLMYLNEGFILLDDDFNFIFANPKIEYDFALHFGKVDDIISKSLWTCYPRNYRLRICTKTHRSKADKKSSSCGISLSSVG